MYNIVSELLKNGRCKLALDIIEAKVLIKSKHPGLLEIPKNKTFIQMPIKHFLQLADKKGRSKISRAVTNLLVWNKNKRTKTANAIEKRARQILDAIRQYYS